MIEPELCLSMQEAATQIAELNGAIHTLLSTERVLRNSPSPGAAEEFQVRNAAASFLYEKSLKSISALLSSVEVLTGPAPSEVNGSAPSAQEAHVKLLTFFLTRPPNRPATFPANSRGKRGTRPGHFICARYRNAFCLMVVLSIQGEVCSAYDPTDVSRVAKLDGKMWVPLTTTLPEKPAGRLEFSQGAHVLSMWNPTGGREDWSTEFFAAMVIMRPCDRMTEELRGYVLDFGDMGLAEDKNRIVVPEQFVVADSEGWLK
jgi:hypothetical protein